MFIIINVNVISCFAIIFYITIIQITNYYSFIILGEPSGSWSKFCFSFFEAGIVVIDERGVQPIVMGDMFHCIADL